MAQIRDEEKVVENNNTSGVNWTGTWKLASSEGLDEYLKDEGWGWVMRKAAGASSATQTLVHKGDTIEINIKNAKGSYGYKLVIGTGKPGDEVKYIDVDKIACVSTAKYDDDTKNSYTETIVMSKKDGPATYNAKRSLNDKKQMVFAITNKNGKTVKRIFNAQK
mmetsp:Transcript_50537/g.61973  ORF Transcript_50537/g.61973 Transcript_50537/m.61973 type:complete len:164 (+) Transcript_50537:84-575(+)